MFDLGERCEANTSSSSTSLQGLFESEQLEPWNVARNLEHPLEYKNAYLLENGHADPYLPGLHLR